MSRSMIERGMSSEQPRREFSDIETAVASLRPELAQQERTIGSSLVLIAGPTASGKSTLGEQLVLPEQTTLLTLDRYYLGTAAQQNRDGVVNFSIPGALDEERLRQDVQRIVAAPIGEVVSVPTYSMIESRRGSEEPLIVRSRVIIEGVYALRFLADMPTPFKIYMQTQRDTLLDRKLRRDVHERAIAEATVRERFEANVWPATVRYVMPQEALASIIVNNPEP